MFKPEIHIASNKPTVVIGKCGGEALVTKDNIGLVANAVNGLLQQRITPLFVLSATQKTTNELLGAYKTAVKGGDPTSSIQALTNKHNALCRELFGPGQGDYITDQVVVPVMKEVEKLTVAVQTLSGENPSIRARVASAGERITPEILKHYLDYLQIAKFSVINATDVIAVRGSFDDADPDPTTSKPQIEEKLLPLILNKQGVFVGGFHGKDPKEEQLPHRFTKTFSRGGSDTTATFLMHILSLLPELYVDSTQLLKAGAGGLMTADPKIVDGAQVIDNLPYEIAKTASYMGAKVLHAKATAWAEKAKKPIDCLSLQEGTGTRINGESTNSQTVLTLLKILSISLAGIMDKPGIARDVSNAIASLGIDINIIAQPNDGLFRLTVPYSEDDDSIQNLSAMQEKYREINFLVDSGYAIGLVGLDANSPSLQMKMLEGLNDTQVGNEYSLISGKNCTTILLSRDEENAKQAIRNIHKRIYDSVS